MSAHIASAGPRLRENEVAVDGLPVLVIKLQDDPLCLRVSLGGDAAEGYYLTYRGDEKAIADLLSKAARAFRETNQ